MNESVNKCAVLTTIFPMRRSYLVDFFDSLAVQTYKGFDVVVVNDGYADIDNVINGYTDLSVDVVESTNTPSKNREAGINYCIDRGYEYIVFGDSDDWFPSNRLSVVINKLNDHDIVVNDLSLYQDGEYSNNYLSKRLKNNCEIGFEFIKDKNVFGLTNTAVSLKNMNKISVSKELVAFDWYFYSILLLRGFSAIFTNETHSYYRQYEDSLVGLGKCDLEHVKKCIDVKMLHYKALSGQVTGYSEMLSVLANADIGEVYKRACAMNDRLWWEI